MPQPTSQSDRHCAECGMLLGDPGEFHPYAFCLLRKAGAIDPWKEFRWLCAAAGVVKEADDLPSKPPLVRDLRRARELAGV